MGIMYIVALFLLSGVVQACPENCYCETDSAECVIEGCNVDIILDVPILVLHGDLCDSQRDLLLHLTDSQIILHGSPCRELPNCRYVTKLFSKYINFKIILSRKFLRRKIFSKKIIILVMIPEKLQQNQLRKHLPLQVLLQRLQELPGEVLGR